MLGMSDRQAWAERKDFYCWRRILRERRDFCWVRGLVDYDWQGRQPSPWRDDRKGKEVPLMDDRMEPEWKGK
jgi:hypothetical protein